LLLRFTQHLSALDWRGYGDGGQEKGNGKGKAVSFVHVS
jgi:hypothetical protein